MMEALPVIMFAVLTILLMFGFPVAFTLLGTSLAFGLIGFGWDFFNLLPLRIWGTMNNFTLLAVPLFIFMGVMLERSGLAEDLLETMALLFGRMCGGLAVSVVFVGMLLGASTGIVGATVVTMGLISLPTMLRRGYQTELATGVIAASGTLGQIIPPSIVLVLLGDIIGVSVGKLFMGAIIPGMVLVGLYVIYIIIYSHLNKSCAPTISDEEWAEVLAKGLGKRVIKALVPPLLLMTSVLGSIFAGIASPTEAAAVGATGSVVLAIVNGRFTFKRLQQTMTTTTVLTAWCSSSWWARVHSVWSSEGLAAITSSVNTSPISPLVSGRSCSSSWASSSSSDSSWISSRSPSFISQYSPRSWPISVSTRSGLPSCSR